MTVFDPKHLRLVGAIVMAGSAGTALPLYAHADATVIVNAANNASLDEEAIASVFLGQSHSFPGGTEAMPVNQKSDSAVAQEFAAKVLKKNPSQLRAYWAKQVFTGGGKAPKELDGDDAVTKFVAANPGAIGYVEGGKLGPGVKAARK